MDAAAKRSHRALFPVVNELVYLNHAAVGPLSTPAYAAIEAQARDQRDYGAMHWKAWYAEYDLLRSAAARLINAEAGEIAILKNTSEGLSFVAEGFPWRDGDNVVTTDLEFPSNMTPWKALGRRGVECRIARSRDGKYEAADIERLIDDRTRIVTVSSVAFHNGFVPDLDAIGDLCARRGVLFCVDAIQSLGALPMDVRRSKITFLAADGHKWLCAPEGAAIFFVAAGQRETLRVLENGWTNIERRGKFLDCPTDLLPDARRFEAGSLNTIGIYGLRAALDLLLNVGIEEVASEIVRITGHLADELEKVGWTVRSPRPIRSGILGATPQSVESGGLMRMHRHLEEHDIITAPREGMIRFSPHFYNDEEDVARVVEAISRFPRS